MATNRELQRDLRNALDQVEHSRMLYLQSGDSSFAAEHQAALTRVHRLRAALGLVNLGGELLDLQDDEVV